MTFNTPNYTTSIFTHTFVDISGAALHPDLKKKVEIWQNLIYAPYVNYGFNFTDFHETNNSYAALRGDTLCRISSKLVKKYGNYWQRFV